MKTLKLLYKCFFVLPIVLIATDTDAQIIRGAELSYKSLGGLRYEITLKLYNYCSDSSHVLATSYDVYEKSACGTKDFTLIYQTTKQIFQTCPSVCNTCQPGFCKNLSLQENIYKGTAVLLNDTCCEREIYFKIKGARYAFVGVPRNLYIQCMINTCASSPNNSPSFNLKPLTVLQPNRTHILSHGAFDKDADTLGYEIRLSQEDSNKVYSPNTLWKIDTTTGIFSINSSHETSLWIKTRVSDFRNGKRVGYATREMEYYIMNTDAKNSIPQITGVDSSNTHEVDFCVGVENCFSIYSSDSNTTDSVKLINHDSIPGLQFTTSPDKKQSATICWTPQAKDAKQGSYILSVRARDNDCDYNYYRAKTYTINLYYATANPTYRIDSCGFVHFNAQLNVQLGDANNIGVRWYGDEGLYSNSEKTSKRYKLNGKYQYHLEVYHKTKGCILFKDSGFVNVLKTVNATLPNDSTFYHKQTVNITPKNISGNGKINYNWNTGQNSQILKTSFTKNEEIILKIEDELGCTSSDTMQVSVFDTIQFGTLIDSLVCPLGDTLHLATAPTGGSWSGLNLLNDSIYIPSIVDSNSVQQVIYSYTDSNACQKTKVYQLTVAPLPQVDAGTDINTCESIEQIILKGKSAGKWLSGNAIQDSIVFPKQLSLGSHEFYYKNQLANTCYNIDTINVIIYAKPSVSIQSIDKICENDSLELTAQPIGGEWKLNGNNYSKDKYFTLAKDTAKLTLFYSFTDSLGCFDTISKNIQVIALPQAHILNNDTAFCQLDDSLVLKTNELVGEWQGEAIHVHSNSTIFYPMEADTGLNTIYWKTQNSAGCESFDTLKITVYPNPDATFSILPNSGCAPLDVDVSLHQENLMAFTYQWRLNKRDTFQHKEDFNFTMEKSEKSLKNNSLELVLYNDYCSDTAAQSIILEGTEPIDNADIAFATVADSVVELAWKKQKNAVNYLLERFYLDEWSELIQTKDTFYTDSEVQANTSYQYRILAIDSCGNQGENGNMGEPMPLTAALKHTSKQVQLDWTPYQKWTDGVSYYQVQQWNGSHFQTIDSTHSTTYTTATAKLLSSDNWLFRVIAFEKNGTDSSASWPAQINTTDLSYIPNAFSPNGDGINDLFKVVLPNNNAFNIKIYNRWGSLIFTGNESQHWDGTFKGATVPLGNYLYVIKSNSQDFTGIVLVIE